MANYRLFSSTDVIWRWRRGDFAVQIGKGHTAAKFEEKKRKEKEEEDKKKQEDMERVRSELLMNEVEQRRALGLTFAEDDWTHARATLKVRSFLPASMVLLLLPCLKPSLLLITSLVATESGAHEDGEGK